MNYRANRTCIYASRDRLGSPKGMRSTTQKCLHLCGGAADSI